MGSGWVFLFWFVVGSGWFCGGFWWVCGLVVVWWWQLWLLWWVVWLIMVVALVVGGGFRFGWWWWLSWVDWVWVVGSWGVFLGLGLCDGWLRRRERNWSFIFILLGSLYYFIRLYVKIRTMMWSVIVKWVDKLNKVLFEDVKYVFFFYIFRCKCS